MIISHRHRFIFVKTRKTAGTSVEIALSQFCGPDDVITDMPAADEEIKAALGARTQQNFDIPMRRYGMREWARVLAGRGHARFREHSAAALARRIVPPDVWDTYYKFCFERNPWDKAVSLYFWRTRQDPVRPPVSEFLRSPRAKRLANYPLYTAGNELLVDHVARYEDIDNELALIADRIGIPQFTLPKAKAGHRASNAHYRDVLSDDDRGLVAEICAPEIKLLGYEF